MILNSHPGILSNHRKNILVDISPRRRIRCSTVHLNIVESGVPGTDFERGPRKINVPRRRRTARDRRHTCATGIGKKIQNRLAGRRFPDSPARDSRIEKQERIAHLVSRMHVKTETMFRADYPSRQVRYWENLARLAFFLASMIPDRDQVFTQSLLDTLVNFLDFQLRQRISPGLQEEHGTIPIYRQTGLALGRSMEKPHAVGVLK